MLVAGGGETLGGKGLHRSLRVTPGGSSGGSRACTKGPGNQNHHHQC